MRARRSTRVADLTDEEIRKLAKARVGWKMHALAYLTVNVFIALLWLLGSGSSRRPALSSDAGGSYYWPIWTHLGWGLGLAIHGFAVYGAGADWVKREEERLRSRHRKP